jgi:UDP-N-acetyl-D-galactosamine dehydrogenase
VPEQEEAKHEYGVTLRSWDELPRADAVIAAVAHREFLGLSPANLGSKLAPGGCFVDVKSKFDAAAFRGAGYCVWRL